MKAHEKLREFERMQMRMNIPDFRVGDRVKVFLKVREGDKERLQAFEGDVIRLRGTGVVATFTVRKVSYGVGVERIFPLHAPTIDHIELIQHGRVRRNRLFYLRKLTGKAARIREVRSQRD